MSKPNPKLLILFDKFESPNEVSLYSLLNWSFELSSPRHSVDIVDPSIGILTLLPVWG